MKTLRAGFTCTFDYWLLAFLSTLLAVLSLSWAGFDFAQFAHHLIGSHIDRYLNAWANRAGHRKSRHLAL